MLRRGYMVTLRYVITPNVKIRMTRRDTWRVDVRPAVLKWRAFQNKAQALAIDLREGDDLTFVLPMPASWSKAKRAAHDGKHHRSKPDMDNLHGGLFDAVMPKSDAHFAELGGLRKLWGEVGQIVIRRP
jgi:Holliday junction resolvase RusA-like endonuclease